MIGNMKKTIVCPNCKTRVTINGLPGERVFVTCPRCNTPGFFTFPKTVEPKHLKQKEEVEPSKILLTPKRLLAIGIAAVFTIPLMFCVILPTIQGSMHFLIVLSGSMSPEINAGDVVVSMRVNPDEINVDDVITFRYKDRPENFITHRVVNVINENGNLSFVTKGDANEDPDQRIVESSELVGKVAFVIPYLGYLPHFARTKIGFVTLVIIPGSLIITNEIWNIIKTLKKKKSKGGKKIKNIIIVGYAIVAISAIVLGYTSSYFYDIEVSSDNILQAGTADIADHLVISEVQIAGEKASYDFVEIYNPTNTPLDISGYKLRKRTSTGSESSIRVFPSGSIIKSNGYFLWANSEDGYAESVGADVSSTATLAKNNSIALLSPDGTIIDAVAWGESQNPFVEGSYFPKNPMANESIERKAQTSSTNTTMASGGVDEFNGNGQDTDDNSADFVLRENPQPQNSLSTPEKPPWPPK